MLRPPPRSAAVSWGDNQYGQLGIGSTTASAAYAGVSGLGSGVAQVSAGSGNSMALTAGATVWTWGNEVTLGNGSTADSTVPVQVPGLAGVTQIAAGGDYSLAVHQVVLVFVPGGVPARSGVDPAPPRRIAGWPGPPHPGS